MSWIRQEKHNIETHPKVLFFFVKYINYSGIPVPVNIFIIVSVACTPYCLVDNKSECPVWWEGITRVH